MEARNYQLLELTANETNQIINALGEQKCKDVFNLFNKILAQVENQNKQFENKIDQKKVNNK